MEVMVNLIPEFKQYMHIIDENKVFWDQKVAEGEEELCKPARSRFHFLNSLHSADRTRGKIETYNANSLIPALNFRETKRAAEIAGREGQEPGAVEISEIIK